jgi:hypothetical protein
MSSKWLDDRYKARDMIQNVRYDLRHLANAFRSTGNEVIADKLEWFEDDLTKASELTEGAFNSFFNQAFEASQQASANVLHAALAGIVVATKKEGDQE